MKRLPSFGIDPRTIDKKGINLYPDIIVHHRGTENNLIAIEAKPSPNNAPCKKPEQRECDCDRCKLRAYKADLGYQHTFYVIFPVEKELEKFTDSKLADYVIEI